MNDFLNGSKPRRVWDFAIKFFFEMSVVKRKGSKKALFRENLFRFQIFQTFGNLEIT